MFLLLLCIRLQISKSEVDKFWKEQLIPPSCHFLAKWKSQADKVKDLWAVVELPQKNHSPRKIQFVVAVSSQPAQGMNLQVRLILSEDTTLLCTRMQRIGFQNTWLWMFYLINYKGPCHDTKTIESDSHIPLTCQLLQKRTSKSVT